MDAPGAARRDRRPIGRRYIELPDGAVLEPHPDAAFRFRGRTIQLPQNFRPEPHAIHGHAWREPWTVLSRSEAALTLEYRHPADAWPWTYAAQQAFDLTDERLRIRFTVTNAASEPMPVGFGLHPYFVRTPRCTVRANVGRMWQADAGLMPVSLVPPPPQLLLDGAGLNPDATTLDNNFVGFGGQAVIEWPEWNARLRMDADPVYACPSSTRRRARTSSAWSLRRTASTASTSPPPAGRTPASSCWRQVILPPGM